MRCAGYRSFDVEVIVMRGDDLRVRRVTTVACVLLLWVVAFPAPFVSAQVVPQIQFLNPSGFATAGERGVIVSDLTPDAGPACCDRARGAYRLSAWVANAPPGARVFFSVVQRTLDIEITNTEPTSASSWEANWSIPDEIIDGPATLFAYLVVGDEPVAVDEQLVTILRVEAAAQLTYPESGGSFGSYTPLASAMAAEGQTATRKLPIGVVDALYAETADLSYVRSFYTTSAPGTEPQWKACGTELIGTSSNSRAGNGVRCNLASAADQSAITAVAAVTNDSPDDFEARFNQSGDAVAVASSYAQQPTTLSLVTEGFQRVEREPSSERFYCSVAETVSLTDQAARQIAGANVDVHATGPNDQLKFDTFTVLTINKAPDRGDHTEETAFDCLGQRTEAPTAPPANGNPDTQGEHQRFGAPDRKHIETLAGGTNDIGRFSFRLHATEEGDTEWTAWLDEADDGCLTNDDAFTEGELNVTGAIGWGQHPNEAIPQPFEPFVACGGTEPEPPVEEDGSRSVSLRFAQQKILVGKPVRFAGRIKAVDPTCAAAQKVVLKIRKPGGKFWKAAATTTDTAGRFTFKKNARVPRDYKAVAPAASFCERASSSVLTLR